MFSACFELAGDYLWFMGLQDLRCVLNEKAEDGAKEKAQRETAKRYDSDVDLAEDNDL
jgi:hypothetical protein